jgi:N-acetylglucosamine kinase
MPKAIIPIKEEITVSNNNNYVLGIDGGGTKTTCILANHNGEIISQKTGKPSALYQVSKKDARLVLQRLIESTIRASNLDKIYLDAICIGIAGGGNPEIQEFLKSAINEIFANNIFMVEPHETSIHIQVCGDAIIALNAATLTQHGVVVISGTGSVAYGETINGQKARAGGWGAFLSFEGSGYDIGRKALQAVMKDHDGRGGKTMLKSMILEKLGLDNPMQLFRFIQLKKPNIGNIASLAPIVSEANNSGDTIANSILKEAGKDLAVSVLAVASKLEIQNAEFPLVLSGGILTNIKDVANELATNVSRKLSKVHIVVLDKEPAYGAVKIALGNTKN